MAGDKWDQYAQPQSSNNWEQYAAPSSQPSSPDPTALANQSGGRMVPVPSQPTQFEQERNPANQQGFFSTLGNALGNMVTGTAQSARDIILSGASPLSQGGAEARNRVIQNTPDLRQQNADEKAAGHGLLYRSVAPLAGAVGVNVPAMEHQSDIGNAGGVLGEAAAPLAMLAAGEGVKAVSPKIGAIIDNAHTTAARSQFPAQMAQMPARAIIGTEGVFRAAAPVGSDPQFRGALYETAGDLADIGRKVDISEAKGGVLQPDMRVRATVNAINDHLGEMYQQERAPQIARHAANPMPIALNADAKTGLNFLSQSAGLAEDRAIAAKALQATPENPLTLAETDQLAKVANKELVPYAGMTPAERAVTETGQMRYAGLTALDRQLGDSIGQELQRRGEPGLQAYEKRYATLSQVRDQLQNRMNMAELQRTNPVLWAKAMAGGAKGMAGASMSATSNVNLGRELQGAFRNLADSGITAKKGVAGQAPQIRGLLPETTGGPFDQNPSNLSAAQRMIQNGSLPTGTSIEAALQKLNQGSNPLLDPTQQKIADYLKVGSSGRSEPSVSSIRVNSNTPDALGGQAIQAEQNWFQQAKTELGPNASISQVAMRAQDLKRAAGR